MESAQPEALVADPCLPPSPGEQDSLCAQLRGWACLCCSCRWQDLKQGAAAAAGGEVA